MKKILIVLLFSLLMCKSFADEYIVIDGQPYEQIFSYYVEKVMPEGSLINNGWRNRPNLSDNLGVRYFVYGLTNVIPGKNYEAEDSIVGIITNQYAYDYEQNRKCMALVLLPKPEQTRIAARAAQYLKDETRDRKINLQAKQNVRIAEIAENAFHALKVEATNGSASSQYQLANYYLNGLFPAETNFALGTYWISKAAKLGNTDAKAFLKITN